MEKDITLAFSKVLGQKLTDTGLYDVLFTRTDDSFIALGDRVAFARAHHADLFVSIHANSFWAASAQGTTIYTVSEQASDKMVAEIAETENKSDVLAGIDISGDETDEVKDILLDLTRRETRNFGVVFRPQPGQGTRDQDEDVQGSAPAGELQGAGGARRALGDD